MSDLAYPLQWPTGWPRTPLGRREDSRYRFARGVSPHRRVWTLWDATQSLLEEIRRLGGTQPVVSTNYALRLDGLPKSGQRTPEDTGVAVYFTLKGAQKAMACDLHTRVEENMRSLTLSIEALRALGRHGGGHMLNTAFTGFTALPPPGRHWTTTLGLNPDATYDAIQAAWKSKVRNASDAERAELNVARDNAISERVKLIKQGK